MLVKRTLAIAAFWLLLSFGALAQSQRGMVPEAPAAPSYKLKPDVSLLGMQFEAAGGNSISALPFDRPYESLSAAQQALVKAAYEFMGEGDEPPFPIGGLVAIYDPITRGQQRVLLEGRFEADVQINSQGEATSIAVLKSPGEPFTKFVAGVALLAKYKPARCNGVPCAMAFPIRVNLKVE
jgi:hypothetical protein